MKMNKILLWLPTNFVYFGIAHSLQKQAQFEIYAVIDVSEFAKKFYQNQKIVEFKKIWFYRDQVLKLGKNFDKDYLANFEEKHGINLWGLIYSDTIFYKYNQYHNFNESEILPIIEKECKFFESILDEIKPNFLITKNPDTHQGYLLHELCKSKGVIPLTLGQVRFGNRTMMSIDTDKIDNTSVIENLESIPKTKEELLRYMKEYSNLTSDLIKQSGISNKTKLLLSLRYLRNILSEKFKNFYANKGRNFFLVIVKSTIFVLKASFRKNFLDRNAKKNITINEKFVYFPLHFEPEISLSLIAPFNSYQIETVENVAKSIPIGCKLFVKEHPMMGKFGWRNISDYKKIKKMPSVELIHPSVPNETLLTNCSLVVSIAGTSSLEAAFYGKPSIVFAETIFSDLPSVYKINKIDELPNAIRLSLKKKVDIKDLVGYVALIENNSFKFNLDGLTMKSVFTMLPGGVYEDVEFEEVKVRDYLKENQKYFEILSNEFTKKIQYHINRLNGS